MNKNTHRVRTRREIDFAIARQYLSEGGKLLIAGAIFLFAIIAFATWNFVSAEAPRRGADWKTEQVV